MYFEVITQCARILENFEQCLNRAQAYALERKIDVDVLLNGRLAPDMQTLIYQIQSGCDYLKAGAAWLSGRPLPRHADTEQTIEELRQRIAKTLEFVRQIEPGEYAGAAGRQVPLAWAPGHVAVGADYLLELVVPSVHFHVAMAYAILRSNGVDVGKMDYLGQPTLARICAIPGQEAAISGRSVMANAK